jgi:hypothetical protein
MLDPRRLADHWLQRCYGFPLRLAGSGTGAALAAGARIGRLVE